MARGKYAKKSPVPVATILEAIAAAHAAAKLPRPAASADGSAEITANELRVEWSKCVQLLETAAALTEEAVARAAEVEARAADVEQDREAVKADRERSATEREAAAHERETVEEVSRDARGRSEALDVQEQELAAREHRVEQGERALDGRRRGLDQEADDVVVLRQDAEKRLVAVKNAERELDAREQKAQAGFAEAEREALRPLRERREALHAEIADLEVEKEAVRAGHDEMLREALNRQDAELAARREQLQDGERELLEARRQVKSDLWLVEQQQADIDSQRADIEREVQRRGGRAHDDLLRDLARAREDLDRVATDRADLERRLQQQQRSEGIFAERSPEDVAEELIALRDLVSKQKEELRQRPSVELRDIATRREQERDEALEDLALARREADELRARLGSVHVGRLELEMVRDERDVLAQKNETYRRMIDEHKAEWARLVEGDHARPVFELMSAMDADEKLQAPCEVSAPQSLTALLTAVRKRIARQGLYYSEHDLRLFLAGMAMSRLTILEGLSGIGKTSLPREFAYALGGKPAIVEVQSGWRDRQDLLGHYNTFERRYEESGFVEALYRAQCPEFAERVFIVILDEMNLSYPELYLSDLNAGVLASSNQLHTQRRHATADRLTLMNRVVSGAPQKLVEQGRKLVIPQNVWFAGTANQDETTLAFGDKTYDRAHVQHLPAAPEPFGVPKKVGKREIVSVEALRECFKQAHNEYADPAEAAVNWLGEMRSAFVERAEVAWGRRLEDQVRHFVPIILATEGDIGEAVDHIVATRILRKVSGRHDIPREDISALASIFEKSWSTLGAKSAPTVSLGILQRDLVRLQHGG